MTEHNSIAEDFISKLPKDLRYDDDVLEIADVVEKLWNNNPRQARRLESAMIGFSSRILAYWSQPNDTQIEKTTEQISDN